MEAVIGIGLAVILAGFTFADLRWEQARTRADFEAGQAQVEANFEESQNEESRLFHTEEENERSGTGTSSLSHFLSGNSSKDIKDREDLRQAIIQKSLPEIQRLVKSNVDLEYQYEYGKRALHLACENGSLDVCKSLLNYGANPATRDLAGRTPILCAVEKGRLDILKHMMSLNVDASIRDNEGRTAVLIAVERGDVEMLQELYTGCTPGLAEHMLAIQKGRFHSNPEVIEFLEKEEVLRLVQRRLKIGTETSERTNFRSAPESMAIASYCVKFCIIVNRQISEPESLSTYVNRMLEATKGISEDPHDLTSEESQLFATLYRAIFDESANNNKASAEAHLTVVKIIAKTLGLESEIEMSRTFGPEPRLYALSVESTPKGVMSRFLQEIRRYLVVNKDPDSFGSLFNVGVSTNTKVMCCVFGSRNPNKFKAPKELIYGDTSVPVLIIADSVNKAATSNGPPTSWVTKPVRSSVKIDLSGYSVGQKGDMDEAGSFGFYGDIDKKAFYGFTAAHCTPKAEYGSIIVSPSTRELTGRLEVAVQYTSFAPTPKWIQPRKEAEVRALLGEWSTEDSDEGCKVREIHDSGEIRERRIILTGPQLGIVRGKSATYVREVLEKHNRLLNQQLLGQQDLQQHKVSNFHLPYNENGLGEEKGRERFSRIEWCCFEVSEERCGGNRLNSDTRQDTAVKGFTLLKPDMMVSKIGRTTGETQGIVNGCIVQRWVDNHLSMEIAVLGSGDLFADVGDSGSLVTTDDENPRGVGMLIGKNVLGSLGLVSPLWAVLEDVEAKLGQKIDFYTE